MRISRGSESEERRRWEESGDETEEGARNETSDGGQAQQQGDLLHVPVVPFDEFGQTRRYPLDAAPANDAQRPFPDVHRDADVHFGRFHRLRQAAAPAVAFPCSESNPVKVK